MRQDTVATQAWIAETVAIPVFASVGVLAITPLPERKAISIPAHATATIYVGHSVAGCVYPIQPGDAPFQAALGPTLTVYAYATAPINHPVVQIA